MRESLATAVSQAQALDPTVNQVQECRDAARWSNNPYDVLVESAGDVEEAEERLRTHPVY